MKKQKNPYQITIASILFALLCAVFYIGFALLGVWQWSRYQASSQEERWNHGAEQRSPVAWSLKLHPYERVHLTGSFDNQHTVLLVNRLSPQGHPEAEVYTPFRLQSGGMILVSRGFVTMPPPASWHQNQSAHQLIGYWVEPDVHGFTLGPWLLNEHDPLWQIQRLDKAALAKRWGYPLLPGVVRMLSPTEPALRQVWILHTLSPLRHLGYALQWWILSLGVIIGFVNVIGRTRPRKHV